MTKEDAVRIIGAASHHLAQKDALLHALERLRASGDRDAMTLIFELSRLEAVEFLYNELVFNVASKFQGESRHATALRYIKEKEQTQFYFPSADSNAYKAINIGLPPNTLEKIANNET